MEKINTTIKRYQDEMIDVVNRAELELPPIIIQLMLRNIILQVNTQVDAVLRQEAQIPKAETIQND